MVNAVSKKGMLLAILLILLQTGTTDPSLLPPPLCSLFFWVYVYQSI